MANLFYVACVYNPCHQTNQNRSKMGLMSHISCLSDAFPLIAFIFLIDLMELISFDDLYLFNDESNNDGSRSGSPGTCDFPFCSYNSVDCASDVGSGVFVSTGIESIGDVVPIAVFLPRRVGSKCGQLVGLFRRPNY